MDVYCRLAGVSTRCVALPRSHGAETLSPVRRLSRRVARGPCHSALWSVAGSVKMWVKGDSFLLTVAIYARRSDTARRNTFCTPDFHTENSEGRL
jgi:hypothetical protein